MSKHRVVIVGMDGCTQQILQPLIKEGKLPTLAKLQREGVAGKLWSVVPPITPAAWSSFYTGKLPGKHGVFRVPVSQAGLLREGAGQLAFDPREEVVGIRQRSRSKDLPVQSAAALPDETGEWNRRQRHAHAGERSRFRQAGRNRRRNRKGGRQTVRRSRPTPSIAKAKLEKSSTNSIAFSTTT